MDKKVKAPAAAAIPHRTPAQLVGIILRILRAQTVATLGLTLIYLADLGVAPWDMLAIGISYHTPLQYGLALNATGIVVILSDIFMREKIGLTTVQDVLISGLIIDLWVYLFRHAGWPAMQAAGIADAAATLPGRIIVFILGVLVFCLGQLLVQSQAMGAGPRDTLVLGLGRRVPRLPIGAVTWGILAFVFLLGLLLGGPVGIGTVGAVFGMSLGQQLMCRLFHFEPRNVRHENILETLKSVR